MEAIQKTTQKAWITVTVQINEHEHGKRGAKNVLFCFCKMKNEKKQIFFFQIKSRTLKQSRNSFVGESEYHTRRESIDMHMCQCIWWSVGVTERMFHIVYAFGCNIFFFFIFSIWSFSFASYFIWFSVTVFKIAQMQRKINAENFCTHIYRIVLTRIQRTHLAYDTKICAQQQKQQTTWTITTTKHDISFAFFASFVHITLFFNVYTDFAANKWMLMPLLLLLWCLLYARNHILFCFIHLYCCCACICYFFRIFSHFVVGVASKPVFSIEKHTRCYLPYTIQRIVVVIVYFL